MVYMQELISPTSISGVIQLAVAPVFLLTGVGSFLAVLTNRLGRIVDRARFLRQDCQGLSAVQQKELGLLDKRVELIHYSISLCTFSAFLVCVLIAALFVLHFLGLELPVLIASLFTAAMLSLIIGLMCFQREVFLAIRAVRVKQYHD